MSDDQLIVQVAFKIKLPPGVAVTKAVLHELLERVKRGQRLPKNVTLAGIFWRNPDRKGKARLWRWHIGADLSAAPSGAIDAMPRGSLQDAIETLSPFLNDATLTF